MVADRRAREPTFGGEVVGSGGYTFRHGGSDKLAGGSDADGYGPVGFPNPDQLVDVEMLVMSVAEKHEDLDVGEAEVGKPLVDVVDLTHAGGGFAAGELATEVACPDRDLLEE